MEAKRCMWCGEAFAAKTKRAQYCSDSCRVHAFDERQAAKEAGRPFHYPSGLEAPVSQPGPSVSVEIALAPGSILEKVRERLAEAPDTWQRAMALTLANRLDHSEKDSATSVANLSQQLEHLMGQLDPGGESAGDEIDVIASSIAAKRKNHAA